jgi:hypothetical protein
MENFMDIEWNIQKFCSTPAQLKPIPSSGQLVIRPWTDKYWFQNMQEAVGVYREVLDPPLSTCDVTYWLNYVAQQDGNNSRIAAIDTAVEATTLNERTFRLRPQDEFLRDNIREDDVLVVSIGGNDVALAPSPCTIANMSVYYRCHSAGSRMPLLWRYSGE